MNADKFVVRGQTYDVLSPATFGDYIETVGAACINPLGYDENKLFLAYDDNVQKLFRATAAIAYSELLIKDTNCEPTTMAEALANALSAGGVSYDNTDSGLTASNVQDAIDEVNGDVETVNSDLSNIDTEISTMNNELGAKNICPNRGSNKVENGVTFTVKSDGSVEVSTGTGGATAATVFDVLSNDYFDSLHMDDTKQYILSGCPSGGDFDHGYCLRYNHRYNDTWYLLDNIDLGNGKTITPQAGRTGEVVQIRVASGTVITTPITFKPMIRPAIVKDSTYVPYAKTNRELTEGISKMVTVTGTTSANGNVALTVDGVNLAYTKNIVTSYFCYNNAAVAMLYVYDGKYNFHVIDAATGNVLANTAVTFYVTILQR